MCLTLGKRQSDLASYKDIFSRAKNEKVTCWKVYSCGNGYLRPACFSSNGIIKKPGIVKSNRRRKEFTDVEKRGHVVEKGIHVYTNKKMAQRLWIEDIIIPVICDIEDLVSCGTYNEAVFMKVRITSRTWKSLFPPKNDKKL